MSNNIISLAFETTKSRTKSKNINYVSLGRLKGPDRGLVLGISHFKSKDKEFILNGLEEYLRYNPKDFQVWVLYLSAYIDSRSINNTDILKYSKSPFCHPIDTYTFTRDVIVDLFKSFYRSCSREEKKILVELRYKVRHENYSISEMKNFIHGYYEPIFGYKKQYNCSFDIILYFPSDCIPDPGLRNSQKNIISIEKKRLEVSGTQMNFMAVLAEGLIIDDKHHVKAYCGSRCFANPFETKYGNYTFTGVHDTVSHLKHMFMEKYINPELIEVCPGNSNLNYRLSTVPKHVKIVINNNLIK